MLKVYIKEGKGGRYRWFAVRERDSEGNYMKRIVYSCFPNSFETNQQAWEDAEWAIGVSVTMVYDDPDEGFEQFAGYRDWQ